MKFCIYLVVAFILMTSNWSFGAALENSRHTFKDLGLVELKREDPGEPISTPERLTITLKCANSKKVKQVAFFRMCNLAEHEFDDNNQTVKLKIVSSRIVHDTGEVICDQVDDKEIQLSDKCLR